MNLRQRFSELTLKEDEELSQLEGAKSRIPALPH